MESANPAGPTPATRIMCPNSPPGDNESRIKPGKECKQPPGTLPQTGFVKLAHLLTLVPMSQSTLLVWVKAHRFPAPVKLGPRMTVWRCEDVRAWMESFQ